MDDELGDLAHEKHQEVYRAVTELVNKMLEGTDPYVEDYVRTKMGDEYRFWK